MKYIVKLFPEITIKSRSVRRRFIQRLQSNLQIVLKRIDPNIRVSAFWDKLEVSLKQDVQCSPQQVCQAMQRVPGIQTILEVAEYPLGDFDDVLVKVAAAYQARLVGKTFKVRVKRSGKHAFRSVDLERYLGGGLLALGQSAGVDVHQPDLYVDLEVSQDKLYVVQGQYPGQGGYPLGSQEAVLSLLSGGFDSLAASYMSMRRGSKTHFLFFNLGGAAHELGVRQIALQLWQQYGASARVKFISIPFAEVVGDILQNIHHGHMGVVLKRQMLRAAEQVADYMKIDALVTGESIAQVSSQTIPNLAVIDRATEKLVIRPLITTDKQDIVNLATELGFFELIKSIPEYCGVISDRPNARVRLERVLQEERNLQPGLIEQVVAKADVITIDDIAMQANAPRQIEALSRVAAHQTIVDIRALPEQDKQPLNMPGCTILHIPFYQLEQAASQWPTEREYLLYCDKGVMSQLHAQRLQDLGYSHVKVFQPESSGIR